MSARHVALAGVAGILIGAAAVVAWRAGPAASGADHRPGRRDGPAPSTAPVPVIENRPSGPAPPAPPPRHAPVPDAPLPPTWQPDPAKPGYDATKLLASLENDAVAVFEAEPRDEVWAPEREGDLKLLALPEIRDADRDARIEIACHTATCRLRLYSRNPTLTDVLGPYPLTCLATSVVPMWGPSAAEDPSVQDPFSDFYMVFGPETRDRTGMIDRVDGTCARYRDKWRQRALKP